MEHVSNVIYIGKCSCGEEYICEMDRNVEIRWREHGNESDNSNPSRHLNQNITNKFEWKVIKYAPRNNTKRKILEELFVSRYKPKLNNQVEMRQLTLLKYGI